MKDADVPSSAPAEQNGTKTKGAAETPAPPTVKAMLTANVTLLESAVRAKEIRVLAGRLMRQTTAVRKRMTADDISTFVREKLPHGGTVLLLSHLSKVCRDPAVDTCHCCRRMCVSDCLPSHDALVSHWSCIPPVCLTV